jgi:hypothetical protein
MRFQELMPDVLHWLGVKKIDELYSMSDMKYDAIVGSGAWPALRRASDGSELAASGDAQLHSTRPVRCTLYGAHSFKTAPSRLDLAVGGDSVPALFCSVAGLVLGGRY